MPRLDPIAVSVEDELNPADLDACLDILAQLIGMGETGYTPLYERLEGEAVALREAEPVEARIARRLARRDSPTGPDQTAGRSAQAA